LASLRETAFLFPQPDTNESEIPAKTQRRKE